MKRTESREQISQLLYDGTSAKDIAEIVDCSVPFVYLVAREIGFRFEQKFKLDDKEAEIKADVESGLTLAAIARKYDVSRHTIIRFCEAKEINAKKIHERFVDSVPSIVDTNTSLRFEYIGGYKNNEGTVQCRCRFCGRVSEITWQSISKGYASCSLCAEDEKNRIAEIKSRDLLVRQEQKRIKQERLKAERAKQKEEQYKKRFHACPVCGEITDRRKYCSDACANKAANKRHEISRRIKINNVMKDKDISVRSLYKRDNGVCYLCGKPCSYDDYVTRDGAFIAGDWYPSIDHVIPLSKGGEHSWDNVRLAHRLCNSLKSAR